MTPYQVADLYQGALRVARRNNVHILDAMAEMDMLLTAQRRAEIIAGALHMLSVVLNRETPEGLIRAYYGSSRPTTAEEMFRVMVKWINDYVETGGVE